MKWVIACFAIPAVAVLAAAIALWLADYFGVHPPSSNHDEW